MMLSWLVCTLISVYAPQVAAAQSAATARHGRRRPPRRVLGQDALLRWDRRLALWPISLLVVRARAGAGNDGGPIRSALGPDMPFGYDVLDVKVTVTGMRITDISVPSLQAAEPTSQQISEQAIPVLRSGALAAQSVGIDAVSSAIYTSAASAQPLQAALDRLHVR